MPKAGKESATEASDAIRRELTPENVRSLNEYVRSTIDGNGLAGKTNLQLVLIDAIAKTPDIAKNFPSLCAELNRLGCLNGNAQATASDAFAAIQQIKPALEKAGYYLNTDVLSSGEFLIPVEGKVDPSREKLAGLYGNDLPELQPVTVINDPTLEKQGYQIAGFGLLNGGNIDANIKTYVERGRFTQEQANSFDMENVRQATVNHEESHRVLKEKYQFPNRQPLAPEEGAQWKAEGTDFVPTNTVQIDEFLAHSVGMATDRYETMTNIGNALSEFKQDPATGETRFEIGDKNGDYALLQSFVMNEVAQIFEERGIKDFKKHAESKASAYNEGVATYNAEYEHMERELAEMKANGESPEAIAHLEGAMQRFGEFANPQARLDRMNNGWNGLTKDVISNLTDADYQRISDKCMAQAKKYLSQIEATYGKKQAPAQSPTATA